MCSGSPAPEARPGRTLLKLAPLLLPFAVLFLGGLAMTVAQSLGFLLPVPVDGGPFAAYAALANPHILASAMLSLWVAGASAGLSICLGAVLAYLIWRLPARLERLAVVYKVPLILPHIGVAFIVLVFWSQSGVAASLAHQLGLISAPGQFPSLIHGSLGAGMILAYVYKETPFVVILALALLKRMDPRLIQTALMLGATPAAAFRRVALPHMRPALSTAFIILFLYGFGAFDIPFLLGDSSPGMLSIEAFNLYFRRDLVNRPTAMAILVCMFLFSVGFIVLYTRLAARLNQRERKL
ncbi:ABC transporter permease subunit [Pseudodesulfovibrio cashew]|uniref:ABC transporter permease subunit n=1 Tax=Pseudodesulfovibrio cashew TaxID=2678688 RepID=A0A6I6JCY5_9BACT|nr:ABC transporter permease subunit [Pseudodesulfovibrio cashew]QGY38920.1 ABC transporter permease subunit [Pseudodesulfovibrio cashew]